jgi:hypothetical protein
MLRKFLSWLLPVAYTNSLTDAQRELIEYIDSKLVEAHPIPDHSLVLSVKSFTIPIKVFALGDGKPYVDAQLAKLKGSYIPRSVSLTNNGFEWNIFIGLREDTSYDETKALMFLALLNNTNTDR